MKIVRIIARLNVGGPARHVAWLTAATQRAGHESVLVAGTVPPGEDDMSYFAEAQGVAPVRLAEMSREISPKDALTIWKLYRLFRRAQPDIVHTHTAKAGTVGRIAGLLYRWLTPSALLGRPRACRFVHTYHGHVFHSYYGATKTQIFLTIERLLARLATDRIVVISPQQWHEIHKEFGVGRESQFAVIPLGLDTRAFADWRARRASARARFGVTDDGETLLVGIVGRLTEIKNHKLFLDMVARFKARGGDAGDGQSVVSTGRDGIARRVRFVVVGDGHLRRELEDYARALKVDGEVTFAGTRDDPENFYAALDVVALTSLNEGTPLTLIEAMANERAVMATAVGGVVDLLGESIVDTATGAETAATGTETAAARAKAAMQGVDGAAALARDASYTVCERGLRVGTGDAEALAGALARLVEDEALRRELGRRGRAFVEQNYSVVRLVEDVSRLYAELLAGDGAKGKGKVKNDKGKKDAEGKWLKGEKERSSAL